MCVTKRFKHVYWYIYKISGERLQSLVDDLLYEFACGVYQFCIDCGRLFINQLKIIKFAEYITKI